MNELQVFRHELFGEIRTMTNEKDEVFFVGKDVAKALGYSNTRDALVKHVDSEDREDGVAIRDAIGREQKVVIINESGLYSLILSSKLEQAKVFKRWVTNEVLPQIARTGGKHAFSFTPEADTVAQKWRSTMSDFSVMLRQSYDGTKYEREARSAEAVNVHIDKLLWNVTMCGTPDALYRVVNNYTDGFQSRIAIARTPDNTFSPLEDKPRVLTERQRARIQQIAHLLPLMQGEVILPKLEARGREWLEKVRLETMKNDDRIKARQRLQHCVPTFNSN